MLMHCKNTVAGRVELELHVLKDKVKMIAWHKIDTILKYLQLSVNVVSGLKS